MLRARSMPSAIASAPLTNSSSLRREVELDLPLHLAVVVVYQPHLVVQEQLEGEANGIDVDARHSPDDKVKPKKDNARFS